MNTFGSFFTNFFKNFKADPASSLKGAVQVAAAGAVGYATATGKLPMTAGVPLVSSLLTSGVHAMGSNTAQITALDPVMRISEGLPQVLSIAEQIAAFKKQAESGQKSVDTYMQIVAAVAPVIMPTQPEGGKHAAP